MHYHSTSFNQVPNENNNNTLSEENQLAGEAGAAGDSVQCKAGAAGTEDVDAKGINVTFDKAECENTKESNIDMLHDLSKEDVPSLNLDDSVDDTLINDSNQNISLDSEAVTQYSDSDLHNTSVESVPIVDVEVVDKTDEKKPQEKEKTDEKSDSKDDKKKAKKVNTKTVAEIKKTGVKNVRKADSNKVTSKIDNKLAAKPTAKKSLNVDSKVNTTKTAPRVGSKIADYIKKPSTGLIKEENIDNTKLSKNVVNKRKASMPDVKRNSITVMPVSVTTKDRRLSMPASKVDTHTSSKSVGSKSVISENGEDNGKKPIKRTPPKSKWDNIMSNINNGKDTAKNKPKTEVKSRLNVTKSQPPKTNTSESPTKPSVSKTLRTPRSSIAGSQATKPIPKPRTGKFLTPP